MTQRSMFWNGVGTGDANLLTETTADGTGYHLSSPDVVSPFVDQFLRTILNGDENRGPLKNWLNGLEVTGTGTPISVNTGAAVVYGLPYFNTAAVPVSIPTPSTDQRYDRIVVRRDWDARTARITRIAGTEGGFVPELVQSPAPSGTGIYDIPLAKLLVTTGGSITVTDEREFVTFPTVAADDSVGNTTVMPDIVGWTPRTAVFKNLRFMGSDLANLNPSYFSYGLGDKYFNQNADADWGSAASYLKGWQVKDYGTDDYRVFSCNFKVPADYVPGTAMTAYVWWADDWSGATSINYAFAYQVYDYTTEQGMVPFGTFTSTNVTETSVLNTFHRTQIGSVAADDLNGNGNEMVICATRWYNSAGTEKLLILGLEIEYVAYV